MCHPESVILAITTGKGQTNKVVAALRSKYQKATLDISYGSLLLSLHAISVFKTSTEISNLDGVVDVRVNQF